MEKLNYLRRGVVLPYSPSLLGFGLVRPSARGLLICFSRWAIMLKACSGELRPSYSFWNISECLVFLILFFFCRLGKLLNKVCVAN